ncbi:phosphonate C-P lyase system protein PhnG [Marinobacter lacisalsi]|uniref:Phosphonate C-P lyase system protein PhnG n=1 Tax=Marinobacter lacisalsi TaxID=475979 RepID=A0ABV8QGP0_9GAMM
MTQPSPQTSSPSVSERQHWMAVLARAEEEALQHYCTELPERPDYRCLRAAETGLAMVRGRTGGTGTPFNLGEVTLSRCVIELSSGTRGFGYVRGRSRRHAELAALLDALMQESPDVHGPALIDPLHRHWQQQREEAACKAAATRVDFMTMVRGS